MHKAGLIISYSEHGGYWTMSAMPQYPSRTGSKRKTTRNGSYLLDKIAHWHGLVKIRRVA